MGEIKKITPVKLISGFIFKDLSQLTKAEKILEKKFGRIDFESKVLPFNYTNYYEEEFGKPLNRKFVSFKKLILPNELPQIKIYTNTIEEKLSEKNKRLINIDPGYLDLPKLVLATTKDYAHRIYLSKGIFAEITLSYKNGSFIPLKWTYADYRTKEYINIFNQIREIYAGQISV
ncbi:MAG: DUF4416 family protein [Candidatus Omnitrophica bacterium]|nr:DUF4416 family protein [Candidatus Omnitrophota bacterium]